MSIIQIDVNSVIIRQEKLKRAWKLTEDAASMLAYVKHSIAPEISDRNSIGTRLMQVETQIHELERNIRRISGAVENGVLQYQTTENRVRKLGSERGNISYKQVSSIDNRKTSALYFRNNMFDGKAVRKSLVAENYVNGEHVRQLFGDFHKATATLKPPTLDFREEVLSRIALMDGTFMEKVDTLPETKGYLARSFEQVVFGNFSEEVTALGTIGQIGLGLCGLDAVADIRDIGADIYHVCEDEEVPWWQLALDVVALIPLVGAFKNVDEVVSLLKSADNVKYLDEGTELAENIGKKAINSMEQADGSVAGAVKRAEKIFEGSSDVFDDAVESTLKSGSTTTYKILNTSSAEDVNKIFKDTMGYEPPYKPGTSVTEIQLTENATYVRVYDKVNSRMQGGWVMKAEDIAGLTPQEIQNKFALPNTPKYICDVNLEAGTRLRTGEVNPLFGFDGGGQQYDLIINGKNVGTFTNERIIGQ